MERVIFKYKFQLAHRFTLELPKGAKFLHAGMQTMTAQMWLAVPYGADDVVLHNFSVLGTGSVFETDQVLEFTHLQTFFDQQYVWHLYGDL